MVVVFVNWIYILITTYLTGNACVRLLEYLFLREKGHWQKTPFHDLFAGIMCTTCYAQVYSLFGGVGLGANIGLLLFCLIYAVLFGKKAAGELGGWLRDRKGEMSPLVKKGLICVMVLGTVVYALATSGAPKLLDTDWYHAQTIRWIEEYGCVTGVANLFYSLGFNGAQHYFDALYSMKAMFGVSLHAAGGYFGLLLLFHGLTRLAGWKAHRRHIADSLALAEVVYTIIVTAFFADPYTDTLPNCLVFFILTEWIILLETEEKEDFPYALLCIFGIFATVLKTSVVMVVLLVIQPAIQLIRNRNWGKIAGYILTGILIAVPFFITNVRVTGYLVYLASAIDWFDVPWKIDIGIVKYSVDSMIHDARAADAGWDEILHNGLAWVPIWFKNDSISHRILYLAVSFLLVFDIVGTIYFAVKKTSKLVCEICSANSRKHNTLELPMLLPRLVVIIGLIYCFFTIPQVRYCWVFLLFPLVVVPMNYLEKFKNLSRIGKWAVMAAAVTGGAVLLMFTGFYSLRTLGYVKDAVPNTLVMQADYQKYEMKPVEKDGHTFYIREEGGAIVCGYYVFPYVNEEENLDRLVTEERLSDGFYLNQSMSPDDDAQSEADISDTREVTEPLTDYVTDELMQSADMWASCDDTALAAVMRKAEAGEQVTIACIGGSITQGTISSGSSDSEVGFRKSYADIFFEWWEQTFPQAEFSFINAGIGATGSYIGVHRVQKDVLDYEPDLVLVEFSVNDSSSNTSKTTYDNLVRKILKDENHPAVMLLFMGQTNGANAQDVHVLVGFNYKLPMVSYANVISEMMTNNLFTDKQLSGDVTHPSALGHAITGEILWNYLNNVYAQMDSFGEPELFDEPAVTREVYLDAEILDSATLVPDDLGTFVESSKFAAFPNNWTCEEGEGNLTFTITCRRLGLLYYCTTDGLSGQFEVYVDGESVATLNADFSGGWGNYAEAGEVYSSDEAAEHTIVIKKAEDSTGDVFTVLGIMAAR